MAKKRLKPNPKRTVYRDLTGEQFGLLRVVGDTEKRIHGHVVWECKCRCKKIVDVISTNLTSGNTKSCGCHQGLAYEDPT